MITFLSGLVVASAGAILLGASAARWPHDDGSLLTSGVTLLPLGVVAVLVGAPMWAEPHRSIWQQASPAAPGAFAPRADLRDPFSDRWTFRRLGPSLPSAFMMSSPVLTF